jgi:sugar phosphate isomerase/epimerase
MSFYSDSDMDVMSELRAEARIERQRARRICPECGRMGGDHATGCPGFYPDDEQEEEDEE